jgi:plastocyanin
MIKPRKIYSNPFYSIILFTLISIFLIGTASAESLNNSISSKINYKSKGPFYLINFNSKSIEKVKSSSTPKEKKNSAAKKSGSEPPTIGLFNQDIIIPPDVLSNNVHFDQLQLNIPKGATVNWKNHDTIDHNIQVFQISPRSIPYENSKDLSPFDALSITFNQPGEYEFQCLSLSHNSMKGTIFVS